MILKKLDVKRKLDNRKCWNLFGSCKGSPCQLAIKELISPRLLIRRNMPREQSHGRVVKLNSWIQNDSYTVICIGGILQFTILVFSWWNSTLEMSGDSGFGGDS